MKKIKIVTLIGLSSIALAACGVDNTGKETEKTNSASRIESESNESSSTKKDPMLVVKGPLLEVGQYSIDENYGRIELEKIASPSNTIEITSGVFVSFGDIKVLKFPDIPETAQEDASIFYGFEGSQGYDLQFEYTVENKNNFGIGNAAIQKVVLSDGEQIERFMYSEEAMNLEAGSKASNQIGHISIPNSDIDSVKFYINPYSDDTYDSLESQPVEVRFK